MFNKKLIKLLGPPRKKDEPILKRHQDLAASLQFTTEKAIFNLLNQLYRETKITNLCLAGGVALNSVANGKILSKTPFKKIYIQPAASDAGGSLGAALYAANCLYRLPRNKFKTSLLGPGFSSRQIKEFLTKNQVVYHHFPDRNYLINKTAKLIFNNQIVAWFQGKLEWGPRALGNRSILANPGHPKMKDILNKRVKHREPFRPFAPVVCFEDVPKFFACDLPLPEPAEYMLLVYPIKKDKQKLIPAVTHVDGSGRLQAIKRNKNPLYYDLVQAFGKLSGVPVLINTSFNVKGEPIVCTPQDAYNCLLKTGIDVLVIDEFLIFKKDNV